MQDCVPDLAQPAPLAHAGVLSLCVAEDAVILAVDAPERLWAELEHDLDQLHPEDTRQAGTRSVSST
ncbi:hypothetical protein D1114_19170 [Cereibacter sphaeroides]|uniref:Uncharacterized protein n=1 Tax=Cereibacter sphaeroides TaxID=1063 RepID=A0AAX1UGZ1_CERSP|nr:hypothetical protein D1114_19170 [Cereibacter sphaeroides]